MNTNSAWENQSKSLIEVQKKGGNLEKKVREILNWDSGRVIYDENNGYDLQIDSVFPNIKNPKVFASVTYTEPDTRGHSNENKLQLKVGELVLLKNKYPDSKIVLILGGQEESWLPYVISAFDFFFDELVCLWKDGGLERLKEICKVPNSIEQNHKEFWSSLRLDWSTTKLCDTSSPPPSGLLRYKILDKIKSQNPPVHHPDLINNKIASLCLHRSKVKGGAEWKSFIERRWNSIEISRNYFNPMEALVEILLTDAKLQFKGGIAEDVPVDSLLHDLGMTHTLLSEDFVLYSEKYKKDVYIQCKASGGGRKQHGKNIQNRTKEQLTRGIFYRCNYDGRNLIYNKKDFIWISVLDGNWGVTKKSPYKYIHMLQYAGYDKFFCSEDLVDCELNPTNENTNPLLRYLIYELECRFEKS